MEREHQQEHIKNKLHALYLQDHSYHSQELLLTFQKSRYLPNKSHSFKEVSDWADRHRIAEPNPENKLKAIPRIRNFQDQYNHLSTCLSKRQTPKLTRDYYSQNKQKMQLSPITVRFAGSKSKSKLRPKQSQWNPQKSNLSFYDANYQSLNLLYKLKTTKRHQRHNNTDELPLILPQTSRDQQHKLPKTQRISSILRMMKKNQVIQQLKKKHQDVSSMFQIQD